MERREMSEEELARLKERLNTTSSYLKSNDMRITELSNGYAKVEMTVDEKILNLYGYVHGGALFSVADFVAGAASFTTGRDSVTMNASINYLTAATGGKIIGIANEIKAGHKTGVYEVFIFNDQDDLLCRATLTMFFIHNT